MPVRSHVDPCLFVRFIYFDEADLSPPALEALAEIEREPSQDRYFDAWRAQHVVAPHLMFHESYHFWQGLRLPYLHWYGLLSFRAVVQLFDALNGVEDLHEWDTFVPDLYRLELPKRVFLLPDGNLNISTTESSPDAFSKMELIAPLDLLEAAASIAQFQVTDGPASASDLLRFGRWRKRVPSYARIFLFVSRVLGRGDVALRSLLPLINTAFRTTDPVHAFVLLLSVLTARLRSGGIDDWLAEPEPRDWSALFDSWLDDYGRFDADPDSTTDLLQPPFCRLTTEYWTGTSIKHPMLTNAARAWDKAEQENPVLGWVLDQPAWAGSEVNSIQVDYEPAATVVRFDSGGRGNRVFVMQREDQWEGDIRDLLTIWSVVRRAAQVHFDPDHRLCHHRNCPEYGPNYCNTYPIIPATYDSCGFPVRMARLRTELAEQRSNPKETHGDPDDIGG